MRVVLQRVKEASVTVDGTCVAAIGPGLVGLVGFGRDDGPALPESAPWKTMLKKVETLRIFPDSEGKMNRSIAENGGGVLLVSQFTLHADCRKGRRPSFTDAAAPDAARALFDAFAASLDAVMPGKVRTGVFGAAMDVALVNWGPVTILLDSDAFRSDTGYA
ncbi:MAG: D-aminoacyl-tRNA deacylase [Desulfovibrionaceae bacterium]